MLTGVVLLLNACGPSEKTLTPSQLALAKIDSLEAILFTDSEKPADPNAGMLLVRQYAQFYQSHPDDSLAVDMLFKAGEVSMGIGQGNLAVKYFRTVYEDHPSFKRAPEALFLCGFCEENVNSDTAQARFFYQKFVDENPKHELAEDAKFSIQNLGMSDEDLIKMFEENLKKES
jgi:hypothetical protein